MRLTRGRTPMSDRFASPPVNNFFRLRRTSGTSRFPRARVVYIDQMLKERKDQTDVILIFTGDPQVFSEGNFSIADYRSDRVRGERGECAKYLNIFANKKPSFADYTNATSQ